MSTRSFKFAGVGIAVLMGAAVAWAQQGARGGEWARYGADAGITMQPTSVHSPRG